ncbi:MAG: phosphatidylglycerophosphatase A [Pseudomonadota bacterium]
MSSADIEDARLASKAGPALPQRPTLRFMLGHPARWIALGFGSGLAPRAPGTVGTLWAWIGFLLLDRWLDDLQWGLVLMAAMMIGIWACARTAQELALADPGAIVWDEVIAFWAVLWLLMPAGFVAQCVAFALFRFFDAVKPGPVRWADGLFKQARGWRQGFGILFDDLVAALCTLLVIALLRFAWPA